MKVFISADMEGITGIADPLDVVQGEANYPAGRELMVGDVNAAIEGALAGGADEVLVNDSHSSMTNLPRDSVHEAARLIRGGTKPWSMMQGLTEGHDVACFVGYHAKAGTEHAVLNHTYYGQVLVSLRVNDEEVGELGWNAGLAASLGVPVGLVTGDDATEAEAIDRLETVETAVVKDGIDRFTADCLPPEDARHRIREGAKRAVRRVSTFEQPIPDEPVAIEVDWAATNQAASAASIPSVERVAGRTTRVEADSYVEAFEASVAMIHGGGAGRNEFYG
ncbi:MULTISPECIES: M55 family metallopeptidase [unclassified Haladaptatus]|uniref:M55 family metallopeptidase n=1 Tax=unclassified Haladaptatus TaxID=2622732 RepID=UPI00209C16B9|nr:MULTISPECIES: M55 family metallopeptidase [unclassified Haladaptatus]MCO8243099.1 M55 family metallopeptidase [Haladaptatus sp. AB643]MCO8252813.1 M55 family metallopeptidase [Haladaptatus sp. AB618]